MRAMKFLTKSLLSVVLMMLVAGCQLLPKPPVSTIDPNLPTVESVRTISDMGEVGLEWTPVKSEMIKGYYIYRSNPKSINNRLQRVATIKDRYASHYVDKGLTPNSQYSYRMSTFASPEIESRPGQMATVKTKPRLEPVPFAQAVANLPKRVKIIWRPHPNIAVTSYRVERRKYEGGEWKKACSAKGRLSAECIDRRLDDGRTYQYRVLAKTDGGVYSRPTPVMSAKTKKIPFTVSNVRASLGEPKKIVLTWDASTNEDIAYYNIYSSPTPMLLFTKLAKTKDTRYEDLINSNGKTKYYKITAVDADGLESIKQNEAVKGGTLGAPTRPVIVSATRDGGQIVLRWRASGAGVASYDILKTFNRSTTRITNVQDTTYVDSDVRAGVTYEYEVVSVDQYGIQSDTSNEVKVRMPKELR